MSFFSKILDRLGIGGAGSAAAAPRAAPPASANPAAGAAHPQAGGPASSASRPPPQQPQPQPEKTVDVEAQMEQRAAGAREPLNWRTSIVDLMKLLDIDSSLPARKELARELGCPSEFMEDTAKMNMWLHRAVLERIAANGGRLPKELLE